MTHTCCRGWIVFAPDAAESGLDFSQRRTMSWVFRLIVTGRFGIVTGRFGNVTGDSGGT
jgi:hypothetical protein